MNIAAVAKVIAAIVYIMYRLLGLGLVRAPPLHEARREEDGK